MADKTSNDKTLSTLCQCRNILLNKLKNEINKDVTNNKQLCDQFDCDNKYLINILNKLHLAKENLSPVIEEIISNAAKLTTDDYKSLKESNHPICSVTTAQFAGAVEASKLLYEINEDLNDHEKSIKKEKERTKDNEYAINAFVYPQTTVNANSSERIFIDKELMRQLIELHDLLGDTIHRLKLSESSGGTDVLYSRAASPKPSKKSSATYLSPKQSRSGELRMSKTLLTGRADKSPRGSNISISKGGSLVTKGSVTCDASKCENPRTCPILRSSSVGPPIKQKPKKKLNCYAKKTKSQVDAKKRAKQEKKMKKKMEKQRKKEMKRRQKAAKKAAKQNKKSKGYTCCKKKKSKSATYIRYGAKAPVSNINEAKQKIMECLQELSSIRTFVNSACPELPEIDMQNQLEIVGGLTKSRECCKRNFPHIHATLNGIPVVLQLNKETLNTIMQKSPGTSARPSKCKCGPIELEQCPLKADLDYTPVSQKPSTGSLKGLRITNSKTKSLPNFDVKNSIAKNMKKSSKEAMSSAVLWKHPHNINDLVTSSFTDPEILTTPETSITVFSTKKTKDGQKVKLTLTISPMGAVKAKTRNYGMKVPSSYENKHIIPERDSGVQRRKDGFETDESDPGMPYLTDNCSLPDFNVEEQRTRTTLTSTGIHHPNYTVQKELEEMGVDNLLRACRPAKCCRRTVINEKPRNALPYPASLMSLPLDKDDLDRIKADVKRTSSNSKYINYNNYQTFNFETYTKFQSDDNFSWKIQRVYEVRFFEIFRTDKSPTPNKKTVSFRNKQRSKRLAALRKEEENEKTKTRNKIPFLPWLTGFDFNLNLFDILRKKQYKNSDVQTAEDDEDVKIIIPTIYKSSRHDESKSFRSDKRKHQSRTSERISISRSNRSRASSYPYKHEDIACFQTNKVVHKVHFDTSENIQPANCEPFDKSSLTNVKSICNTSMTKVVERKDVITKECNLSKNENNDSLIKLIPLQPYLVEKVEEEKLVDSWSKSTIYNSSMDKVDSRIIYKKFKSEDLYYITSESNKNVDKNSFTSMYKNSIFYPFKVPDYATFYNTIITNKEKLPTEAYPSKLYMKNTHSCTCKDISSRHRPESLEHLMINGRIPCLCSNCDINDCNEQVNKSERSESHIRVQNKLVVVDSNQSLDGKEVEKRHKKTIMKSGKSSKREKERSSKLVGQTSEDIKAEEKTRMLSRASSAAYAYQENLKRRVNNATSATHPSDKSPTIRYGYCRPMTTLDQSTSAERKTKPYNIVKDKAISKQSFGNNVWQFKHKNQDDKGTEMSKTIEKKKSSFYFQCEDDVASKTKNKSEIPKIVSAMKKRDTSPKNNSRSTRDSENTCYPAQEDLHITKNCGNISNYNTPQEPNNNGFKHITNSNVPQPYTESNKTKVEQRMVNSREETILNVNESLVFDTSKSNHKNNSGNKLDKSHLPIKNKNSILQNKQNVVVAEEQKGSNNKYVKPVTKNYGHTIEDVTGFSKLVQKLNKDVSQNVYQAKTNTDKKQERAVKHSFSAYNADVDGQTRPGYLSILKPTCGCPEITVFIPCYCDDNTIFGREQKQKNPS